MAGVVETTNTFATNDVITSTVMNNIIDQTLFTSDALSGSTLALVAGKMKVATSGITSNEMGANAVTTNAIASASSAVTGVTYAKIQYAADMKVLGNTSGALAAVSEVTVFDEDDMVSDSATSLATQQSIKAYVDTKASAAITYGTIQATTSGTAFDFTGIPSTAKRITILFEGVSTTSVNPLTVLIGDSGGIETTGYISTVTTDSARSTSTTSFFVTEANVVAYVYTGQVVLVRLSASSNTWIQSGIIGENAQVHSSAGYKTLSGTLDRIRVSRNTSGAFDAGEINIMYE